METNKQWKRVPFDVELANKIQSGEIEGRIVTDRAQVISRILCYDKKASNDGHIVALVDCNQMEYVGIFSNDGRCFDREVEGIGNLLIELPEETDNTTITDDWYKTEDVKGKIELLASKIGLTYEQFIIVMDSLKGIIKINSGMIQLLDDMKEDIERICETPKQEFKPFDKVLVRTNDSDTWKPDFYSYKYKDGHMGISNHFCIQCIPYEGNEHLVGTTDNLKED